MAQPDVVAKEGLTAFRHQMNFGFERFKFCDHGATIGGGMGMVNVRLPSGLAGLTTRPVFQLKMREARFFV